MVWMSHTSPPWNPLLVWNFSSLVGCMRVEVRWMLRNLPIPIFPPLLLQYRPIEVSSEVSQVWQAFCPDFSWFFLPWFSSALVMSTASMVVVLLLWVFQLLAQTYLRLPSLQTIPTHENSIQSPSNIAQSIYTTESPETSSHYKSLELSM